MRTFVALEVSGDVRARAKKLIAELQQAEANVRWVEPHNLHLTLKFLGEVDVAEINDVCSVVAAAVKEMPSFDLVMHGAGAFPTPARARTVWIGAREGNEQMAALADAIDQALTTLDYPREQRRFQTHLTIGRAHGSRNLDQLADLLRQHAEYVGGSTDVAEVVVFHSQLGHGGPVYEPLAHVPLGG